MQKIPLVVRILIGCQFLMLGGGVGGCSHQAPTLTVLGATITERSDEGLVIAIDIDAANDGDVELPLRAVDYNVRLDGRDVFSGTRSPEATIPVGDARTIRLPAAIPLVMVPEASGSYAYEVRGKLTYTTPGQIAELLFDTGVRVPTVDFGGEGVVELVR